MAKCEDHLTSSIESLEHIRKQVIDKDYHILEHLNHLPVGTCVTDRNGYFLQVNASYAQIYDYQEEELLGKHFTMVVPDEKKKELSELHDLCIAGKQEISAIWEVQDKSGDVFPVLASAAVIRGKDGNPVKVTLVADLTNLKETENKLHQTIMHLNDNIQSLEEKLERQNVAEGILLHDMKKPLRNVIGICDILLSRDFPKEEQQHWLGLIKELEEKALGLVHTLNGFKKIEAGNYEPEWKDTDLLQVLEDIRRNLQVPLENKSASLDIITETPDQKDDFIIKADAPFLELMLANLITNAIEASPQGGNVMVKLIKQDDHLQLTIHNLGVVPVEIRKDFFGKYVSSGKSRGTGLGTYIAKLIAEVHHGTLEMRTSEEKGTTLTLTLPLFD